MSEPTTEVIEETPEVEETEETEPKWYDESYVKALREEAAAKRVKLNAMEAEKDALTNKLVRMAVKNVTKGILADPEDLFTFNPDADLLDDDGMPSDEKIEALAKELATKKPHLASRIVDSDIGQGFRGDPPKPTRTLLDIVQAAAR